MSNTSRSTERTQEAIGFERLSGEQFPGLEGAETMIIDAKSIVKTSIKVGGVECPYAGAGAMSSGARGPGGHARAAYIDL
jgi:hypothetical protein